MSQHDLQRLSRRRFVVGGTLVASLAALGACASNASPSASKPSAGAAPASGAAPVAPAAPATAAPAAAPVKSLRTAFTTAGATMGSLWMADEQGAFREQGLDAEVVFIAAG